jgi:hypothetical protein
MSAGVIASTPAWIPVATGVAAATGVGGLGYAGYRLKCLRDKLHASEESGEEAVFTESEVRFVQRLIERSSDDEKPSADT